MIDFALLTTYVLSIVLFLATLGPVTLLVVNTSTKDGFLAGLKTVMGTNTASLVLIIISFIIMKGVFSVSEVALNWLTLIGSLYLLYFSIGIIQDKVDMQKTIANNQPSISKNHIKDGFLIGISNPKDILFFMAFFPIFLSVYPSNINMSMLILVMIWIMFDYSILSIYSFIFSKINHNQTAHMINKSSGVILLLVSIYAISQMTHALYIFYGHSL